MNMIGIMLENNRAIARDRSQDLRLAREYAFGEKFSVIAMCCAWSDRIAVSKVNWTLQNRLLANRRRR